MDKIARQKSAALTAEQALKLLGRVISRASFYAAINRGEVPHRRLGKRIIIPRHAFMEWLESAGQLRTAIPSRASPLLSNLGFPPSREVAGLERRKLR